MYSKYDDKVVYQPFPGNFFAEYVVNDGAWVQAQLSLKFA
jgi:hypothetical protein